MSGGELLWGLALIAAGVFISVYGHMLFRFALAAMGFGLGFLVAIRLTEGQDNAVRILIAFAVGGIVAAALFALVQFGLYIAGGLLGLIAAFVVSSLIGIVGPNPEGLVVTVLALAGIGTGGFFGPRLGALITVLASGAAGAFLIVDGLLVLFASRLDADTYDPSTVLDQKLTLAVFSVLFAVSALAQYNYMRFRQRVLR